MPEESFLLGAGLPGSGTEEALGGEGEGAASESLRSSHICPSGET